MLRISSETKCILVLFNGHRKGRECLVCGRVILVKREAYERRSPRVIPCFYSCPIRQGSKHQRRGSGTSRWKACCLRMRMANATTPGSFGESLSVDSILTISLAVATFFPLDFQSSVENFLLHSDSLPRKIILFNATSTRLNKRRQQGNQKGKWMWIILSTWSLRCSV